MNKQELIAELAEATELPKSQVGRVLDSLGELATGRLADGEEVTLPGLGKLTTGTRAARTLTSPLVGGKKEVPARTVAKFKASSALKAALN